MKTLVLTTILIASSWPAAAQSCSVAPRPMKPINPLGCSDTRATCVCEPNGNCHWIWACVPVGGTVNSHTDSGIDPSIPLRVRPPQAPDLMDSYRKALEIRSLQQQQSVQPQAEPQAALPTRVASPADSQLTETSWKTVGLANGRAWILFSADEKNIFIIGACDTMLGISPKDYHIYFPKLLKTGEFSNALARISHQNWFRK